MKEFLRDVWELLVATVNKAGEIDIFTYSAAIAFYTIFSITPLLVLVLSLGGLFISEQTVISQIQYFAGDFLEESMIHNLNEYISQRNESTRGFFTTVLAIIAVIFGATTVISQLKTALNEIWNVKEIRINSVWNFVFNRLLSFGMIILFSLLLIASLVAEAAFLAAGDWLINFLPDIGLDYYQIATQIGTIIIATIAFTLMFNILPDIYAKWSDVVVGGMVTTILFLIGKYLIAFYFSTAGIEAVYKAAGSLIIFVIWVYYNVLIVLIGAIFTQVYTEKYGERILPYRFSSVGGVTVERRD